MSETKNNNKKNNTKIFCVRTKNDLSKRFCEICEQEGLVPSKVMRHLMQHFIKEYENGNVKL
jgi:phosphoribosyl-dephospho-CoA transferase